jgi:serine/threonine protein kinase
LNESLKKLLFGMLEADPQKRINLEEALKYEFFQKMSK